MMLRTIIFVAVAIVSLSTAVGAQTCLRYGSIVSLTGHVRSRPYQRNEEVVLILTLDRSVCTTGRDQTGFSPERRVRQIQLALSSDDWNLLRNRTPGRFVLTGSLFHRFSRKQKTRVLIEVVRFTGIAPKTKVTATYPASWFAAVYDPNKPSWEILPQEAKAGEVILSKRNELGILSNFAATPFELYGKRYASVEGFWQMMLYPEGPGDERAKDKRVKWKYTREQVAQMTAFEAKSAGTLAEENMKTLGIDRCTFEGKRFPYRSATPGEHYRLIVAAMRAKVDQNPEVKRVLLATGDLRLRPDHHGEPNPPPEWKYYEILTQIRSELLKQKGAAGKLASRQAGKTSLIKYCEPCGFEERVGENLRG